MAGRKAGIWRGRHAGYYGIWHGDFRSGIRQGGKELPGIRTGGRKQRAVRDAEGLRWKRRGGSPVAE